MGTGCDCCSMEHGPVCSGAENELSPPHAPNAHGTLLVENTTDTIQKLHFACKSVCIGKWPFYIVGRKGGAEDLRTRSAFLPFVSSDFLWKQGSGGVCMCVCVCACVCVCGGGG
jgi:hypothetical protein